MLILQMKLPESSNGVEDTAGNNGEINYEKYINDVLKSYNSGDIAKWINRKFIKLQIFIEYLLKNNNGKLNHDRQLAIFNGVCKFINQIDENHCFSYIFNTFPNTSIDNYCDKTVGEQFSQLVWGKNRDNDGMPEGGSCHYRSLLLYNIFCKLKDAGLDLEIKFFRVKSTDELHDQLDEMGHSGLIIRFQKKDYLVGRDNHNCLIKNVYNFQPKDIIFFETIEEFKDNLCNYSTHKEMAFSWHGNLKKLNRCRDNTKTYIDFSFIEGGIEIVIANELYTFYLDTSKILIKFDSSGYNFYCDNYEPLKFPLEFCKILTLVSVGGKDVRKITSDDSKILDYVLPIIFQRTHIDYIDFFPYTGTHINDVAQRVRKNNHCGIYIPYLDSFKMAGCF